MRGGEPLPRALRDRPVTDLRCRRVQLLSTSEAAASSLPVAAALDAEAAHREGRQAARRRMTRTSGGVS